MGMSEELNAAIREIVEHKAAVIDSLNMSPKTFDSWLDQADPAKVSQPNQQALMIILKWIERLPQLDNAPSVIKRACASLTNGSASNL